MMHSTQSGKEDGRGRRGLYGREGQSAETKEEKGEGRRVVEECKEGRMVEKQ